ncbi:MAG: hypothetical protein H6724_04520 [Sandaracinus sp.]|nr:hypothetical protein [Sandaracinus sp.]
MDLFRTPTPVSLVVAELGSPWESWVERFATGTPDVLVVVQEPGESVDRWAMRVRSQVAGLEAQNACLARAVVVAGPPTAQTLSARSLAIKALVGPMVASGEGTVILDGNTADRFGMMALAQTVEMQVAGTGVTVRAASSEAQDFVAHVA